MKKYYQHIVLIRKRLLDKREFQRCYGRVIEMLASEDVGIESCEYSNTCKCFKESSRLKNHCQLSANCTAYFWRYIPHVNGQGVCVGGSRPKGYEIHGRDYVKLMAESGYMGRTPCIAGLEAGPLPAPEPKVEPSIVINVDARPHSNYSYCDW